jgi:hypothetical protein
MTSFLFTACAVCFGDPSSPLSKGVAAGVAFLIAVIGSMLAAIAFTAYRWVRRARELESRP